MIHFKEDFNVILKHLPNWNELSRPARAYFVSHIDNNLHCLQVSSHARVIAELSAAGFLKRDTETLRPVFRPLRRWMRAMYRHPVFDEKLRRKAEYLRDHLNRMEAIVLLGFGRHPYADWSRLEDRVTEPEWVLSYCRAPSFCEWEKAILSKRDRKYIDNENVGRVLKTVIERCISDHNPLTLNSLIEDSNLSQEDLAKALQAGVRYVLLYAALDRESLNPVIGLWPPLRKRLAEPPPELPEWQDDPPAGSVPVHNDLMLDMTTILVHAAAGGLRAVQGGGLAKVQYQQMCPALGGSSGKREMDEEIARRIDVAIRWCENMGFLKYRDKRKPQDPPRHYASEPQGAAWLSKAYSMRWKDLLDAVREAYHRGRDNDYIASGEGVIFAPKPYRLHYANRNEVYEKHLVAMFDDVPLAKWWSEEELLNWCALRANPLLKDKSLNKFSPYTSWMTTTERETLWRMYVEGFIDERLLPLGGVKAVVAPDGRRWLSLTEPGRYILQQTDRFEAPDEDVSGAVIVQPNFDIVFTAPAPHLEADCARLAERTGHGVGTLFRITRESVLRALDHDVDVKSIMEHLAATATKKLPANVSTQIHGWIKSYRKVTIQSSVLIRCPDIETAQLVQAKFPKSATPLTDTIFELTNCKSITDVSRRLKKQGIGVDVVLDE